jgi:hypothetical protein
LNNRVTNFFGDGIGHFGFDVTGRNRIDGHTLGREFLRYGLGKSVQAGLGRGVVGLAILAFLAVDRGNIDDTPKTTFGQAFDHLAGDVEGRVEIGAQNRAPLLGSHPP